MKRVLRTLALAAVLVLGSVPAYAAEYELVLQSTLPEQNPGNAVLREWIKEVEELSGGRLSIKLVANSAITRIEGAYKGLVGGAVDMTLFAANFTPAEIPYSIAISFPCISKNAVHATNILWRLYAEQEKFKAEMDTVELLAMWGTDRDAFISVKKPILTPADFKGIRFLVMSPGTMADIANGQGGSAVQVGVSDIYIGLQRGMGEALNMAVPTIRALKLQEVAKHIVVFPVTTSGNFLGMNKEVFAELPSDLQAILRNTSGKQLSYKIANMLQNIADSDLEKCRAEGIDVVFLDEAQSQTMEEVVVPYGLESLRKIYSHTTLAPDFDNWYEVVKNTAETTPDTTPENL